MISRICIQNFFSYQQQDVVLNPRLNLLLGINGSGKTNIIKALRLLKAAIHGQLHQTIIDEWGGYDAIAFAGVEESMPIALTFELSTDLLNTQTGFRFTHPVSYKIELHHAADRLNYRVEECLSQQKEGYASPFIYFDVRGGKGVVHQQNEDKSRNLEKLNIEGQDFHESVFSKYRDEYTYPEIAAVRKAIERIHIYESFDLSAQSKVRKPVVATVSEILKYDGSNLAQVLNNIKNTHRESFKTIDDTLKVINPNYEEISFNLLGGNMELMLGERGLNRNIHVRHMSDGTLKFLCLLCLMANPAMQHSVVVIDELENALHPDMLHYLMTVLSQQKGVQYLIATHSPLLVDGAQPNELLIVEKNELNASTVKTPTLDDEWLDRYTAGQLWLEGHLGGTRY